MKLDDIKLARIFAPAFLKKMKKDEDILQTDAL